MIFLKAYPDMPSLQARACAHARNHMATGILDLANDDEESVLKLSSEIFVQIDIG